MLASIERRATSLCSLSTFSALSFSGGGGGGGGGLGVLGSTSSLTLFSVAGLPLLLLLLLYDLLRTVSPGLLNPTAGGVAPPLLPLLKHKIKMPNFEKKSHKYSQLLH